MKNNRLERRLKQVMIYTLLILGSFVFCWPLAWMGFTSFKSDRELFSQDMRLLPETPGGGTLSPYIDQQYFHVPKKAQHRSEVLSLVQARIHELLAARKLDVDAQVTEEELTKGAFTRLFDTLPSKEWTRSPTEMASPRSHSPMVS